MIATSQQPHFKNNFWNFCNMKKKILKKSGKILKKKIKKKLEKF